MTSDVRTLPTGFGRLWTAQTISSLGDGVMHAALPLLALTVTRDPMALAVVTAAGTLPWLFFGVLGGALVDRWDRRHTMWVSDAARALLLGIPAAAAMLDALSISLLAAVAFLLGLGGLFFDTAATAYLPDLLRRDAALLERANSRLRGAQTAMSGFAGPPAPENGFLLQWLGEAARGHRNHDGVVAGQHQVQQDDGHAGRREIRERTSHAGIQARRTNAAATDARGPSPPQKSRSQTGCRDDRSEGRSC